MNKLIPIVAFLICTVPAFAQFGQIHNSNNEVMLENRYTKVEGSPYLFDEWSEGTIYSSNGEILQHPAVNFNGQNGKIEIRELDNKIIALNAMLYNKIEIEADGQKHVFSNRLQGPADLTYYRVIYGGDGLYFLEKFESDIKEEDVANYGVSKSRNRFVRSAKNYLLQDGKLEFTPRSTSKILKLFNSSPLDKYVKKEKLNLKEDADLRKALAYYESL